MAEKKLSEVFPEKIAKKLQKELGIETVQELAELYWTTPWEISRVLSATEQAQVISYILRRFRPAVRKARDLKQKVQGLPKISTGVVQLNEALGGGVRQGTTLEVFGEYGSGKTHMLLTTALNTFRPKGLGGLAEKDHIPRILWIDTENVLPDVIPIAENMLRDRLGLVPDVILENHFDVLTLPTTESLLATLQWLLKEHSKYDVVVIDSIAELIKEEYIEPAQMSERARVLKQITTLVKKLNMLGLTMLVSNHVYANIGGFGQELKAYGGHILGHFATYHIWLKNSNARGTKYCDPKKAITYDVPGTKRIEVIFGTSDWGVVDWELNIGGKKVKICEQLPAVLTEFRKELAPKMREIYPEEYLVTEQ